jgi:hypothetical protein
MVENICEVRFHRRTPHHRRIPYSSTTTHNAMSTRFVPRSDTLEDAIEKFHIAFVDMLVGKTDEGKFVNKGDMYKAMQAAVRVLFLCMQRSTDDLVIMQQLVIAELITCDADTPNFDPLLGELKNMKPLYDHAFGNVPAKEFLRLARLWIAPSFLRRLEVPLKKDAELVTGRTTILPATGKGSTARTITTKTTTSKFPATTKPSATKPDTGSKRTTTTNTAGGTKPSKSHPIVKGAEVSTVAEKIQPRPIKKIVTYMELDESDDSSGEEDGEGEEESGEDEAEEEEVEVAVVKPARRKAVKSPAVITDEMDEDKSSGGGESIKWSAADKLQAAEDVQWGGPDQRDPCLVEKKDLRYGPLYWGSYTTPLAKPGPITKEDLPDRSLNPLDKDGHAKYMLADVYDTPCGQCTATKTVPKMCVVAGSKPNPLGATVEEEKEKASACACCRHHKRRCQGHSRSRSRQIIANPFHDHSTATKGGSGKGKGKTDAKVKTEAKATPAAKTRSSRKPPADNDVVDGKFQVHYYDGCAN